MIPSSSGAIVLENVNVRNGSLFWSDKMAKSVNKYYSCKCSYTAPYICSYCTNKAKAPKWLSIIWKNQMVEINSKGQIRPAKKR
jgi:hypothetical protein